MRSHARAPPAIWESLPSIRNGNCVRMQQCHRTTRPFSRNFARPCHLRLYASCIALQKNANLVAEIHHSRSLITYAHLNFVFSFRVVPPASKATTCTHTQISAGLQAFYPLPGPPNLDFIRDPSSFVSSTLSYYSPACFIFPRSICYTYMQRRAHLLSSGT